MLMDTTDPSYWLNWKFLLCATWVYSCMALACYLIWKYEGPSSPADNGDGVDAEEAQPRVGPGVVYLEDCWKPCLKQIHPGWLLAFRLVSFFTMASILTYDVVVDGWTVFLYYTQWTFLLVTLYFGLVSDAVSTPTAEMAPCISSPRCPLEDQHRPGRPSVPAPAGVALGPAARVVAV